MTKITDEIKIDVTITAAEALRARIVLGRTNGSPPCQLFNALTKKLDPNNLFDPFYIGGVGHINYMAHEKDYENYFFGLYSAKEKANKLVEIEKLERESLEITSRISKLKREIGE